MIPVLEFALIDTLVIFRQPSLTPIAEHIDIQRKATSDCYNVVIIGSGPSGLGAAVYAASEGLSTLAINNIGPNCQAGSRSKATRVSLKVYPVENSHFAPTYRL